LIEAVWPGRIVQDNNLAVQVSALRRLLGTNGEGRPFIQTVPGKGYLLLTGERTPPPYAGPLRRGSSFVGRERECAELAELLDRHRLVTLTAPGGVGKTRLALRVSEHLASAYSDGVHVAELSAVDDPAQAARHIARLFPLGAMDRPIVEQLASFLGEQSLLLVLDNCEHVLAPVAHVAAAILQRCPGVFILATSREPLDIEGEHVFRLSPFAVPAFDEALDANSAMQNDAVRLFVERARAAVPDFALDDATLPSIVSICTRLDGIALAIEMAVPRLRVLAPAQLAKRLRESLDVLATPDRTVLPRNRTLRAVLDWSHALLSPGEQVLLRRLSIFSGPVDFDAVLAVACASGESSNDVIEQIAGLIDKSLVVAEPGPTQAGRGLRYSMLETVREYARHCLADADEPYLRRRHAEHFVRVFEGLAVSWPTTHTDEWGPCAAAVAAELRSALGWCFGTDGDTALGLRLVGATVTAWWELPGMPLRESRHWFDLAVTCIGPNTPPGVAGRVWLGAAWRDMRHDDTENLPAAERAVALFRESGDPMLLAAALWRAGSASLTVQAAENVARLLGEAEHVLRQVPPSKWLGLCLIRLGDLRARTGENVTGLAAYDEGLRIATAMGNVYGMTNGGSNMADLLYLDGRPADALSQLRRLRQTLPSGPRTPLTATLTSHLAMAGLGAEALDAVAEVLAMASPIGYLGALARSVETLALLRVQSGRSATAARLAGWARALLPADVRWAASRTVFDQLDTALSAALPETERNALLAQGAAWDEATGVLIAEAELREQGAAALPEPE